MKENLISDYFTVKSGSKVWPSSDPADSPIDKFTCKICGWSFHHQMYGHYNPEFGNPFDEVGKIQKEHLLIHIYEDIKKCDKHLSKAINEGFEESMSAQIELLKKHMKDLV